MVRMDWARSFMASPAIDYAFSSVEPDVRRAAGSSPQNLAEAPQCEGEQRRSEAEEGEKLGPDDVDAGAAKDDRLRQHDEVRRPPKTGESGPGLWEHRLIRGFLSGE